MTTRIERLRSQILTTEQGWRLGLGSAAIFACLALLSLFSTLSGWRADAQLSSEAQARAAIMRDLSSSVSELTKVIPQAHLFGYQAPVSAYMPITSLQMRLTGIVQEAAAEEGSSFSKAIISLQGGVGKVYQVGDMVMEGIKLMEIKANGVILDNNGHSERLPMQRARLGSRE